MKIAKYLFFLFLIFVIAASIYVATKEANYEVEKEIVIQAPESFVFSEVQNFENWKNWGPWASAEATEVSISGEGGKEGNVLSFRSENALEAAINTMEIIPLEKIVQKLEMKHSFGTSVSKIAWFFEEVEEGTEVTLQITGELSFKDKLHWETSAGTIDSYFAPIFEESLMVLQDEINRKMQEYEIEVHGVTEYGGGYYLYTSASATQQNVQEKFKEIYPQLKNFMNENNINSNGRPFILYHQLDDENGTTLFSVGIPTATKVVTPGADNIVTGYIPNQKVVRTTLQGDRKNLSEAWEATIDYIEENNLRLPEGYKPFEVYITDEAEEKVPARLITEIYIPVEENENDDPLYN